MSVDMFSGPCSCALHALVQFQFFAFFQRHDGLLPIRPLSRKSSHALDLALDRHDMDALHPNFQRQLDRLLDLNPTGMAMYNEANLVGSLAQCSDLFSQQGTHQDCIRIRLHAQASWSRGSSRSGMSIESKRNTS